MKAIPPGVGERINNLFEDLEERAYRDIELEGLDKRDAALKYEMMARYGGQLWEIRFISPIRCIKSLEDMKAIIHAFEEEYLRTYTKKAMAPRGGIEIISIALTASIPTIKPRIIKKEYGGKDPKPALKGEREVYFEGRFVTTRIYDMDCLQSGNIIEGSAIVEGQDTTVVIPMDRRITVDEYSNLVMEYL